MLKMLKTQKSFPYVLKSQNLSFFPNTKYRGHIFFEHKPPSYLLFPILFVIKKGKICFFVSFQTGLHKTIFPSVEKKLCNFDPIPAKVIHIFHRVFHRFVSCIPLELCKHTPVYKKYNLSFNFGNKFTGALPMPIFCCRISLLFFHNKMKILKKCLCSPVNKTHFLKTTEK